LLYEVLPEPLELVPELDGVGLQLLVNFPRPLLLLLSLLEVRLELLGMLVKVPVLGKRGKRRERKGIRKNRNRRSPSNAIQSCFVSLLSSLLSPLSLFLFPNSPA
jgi:hypothetical protein